MKNITLKNLKPSPFTLLSIFFMSLAKTNRQSANSSCSFNQTGNHNIQHITQTRTIQISHRFALCKGDLFYCKINKKESVRGALVIRNYRGVGGKLGTCTHLIFVLRSQQIIANQKKLLIMPNLLFLLLANNRTNEKSCQKKLFWIPIKMKIKLTWLFVTIKTIISQPENLVVVLLACSTKMMHPAGSLIPFACK